MIVFVSIACLLGAVVAAPSGGYAVAAVDSYSVPRYEFNYAVNDPGTGDNKEQSEVRDGDSVKGSYSLREADGTLRVVEYTADAARGFNAVVKRVGAAAHPQVIAPVVSKQVVAPVYQQIAVPVYESIAPVAAPVYNDYSYGHGNLGGLDKELGLGLSALNLGGLGYGDYKH